MKPFSLPAELQRVVAWQGSRDKPRVCCDPTAVLIGRIQKAHAAEPASVSQSPRAYSMAVHGIECFDAAVCDEQAT
jgi:hypothetical protein